MYRPVDSESRENKRPPPFDPEAHGLRNHGFRPDIYEKPLVRYDGETGDVYGRRGRQTFGRSAFSAAKKFSFRGYTVRSLSPAWFSGSTRAAVGAPSTGTVSSETIVKSAERLP